MKFWDRLQTNTKKSMPVVIVDEIEFCASGSSKNSGDGHKATGDTQNPAGNHAAAPASDPTPGNFTGFQSFGGGNSFFNV